MDSHKNKPNVHRLWMRCDVMRWQWSAIEWISMVNKIKRSANGKGFENEVLALSCATSNDARIANKIVWFAFSPLSFYEVRKFAALIRWHRIAKNNNNWNEIDALSILVTAIWFSLCAPHIQSNHRTFYLQSHWRE